MKCDIIGFVSKRLKLDFVTSSKCDEDENECETGSHECDPDHGACDNVYGSYKERLIYDKLMIINLLLG